MLLHPEILIEIVQRYRGELMTLLLVNKTIGRAALDCLVVNFDPNIRLNDSVLGPPRNVHRMIATHSCSHHDINALNPVQLFMHYWIFSAVPTIPSIPPITVINPQWQHNLCADLRLPRLRSLQLFGTELPNNTLAAFTTLTSLDIVGNKSVTDVRALTQLRKLHTDHTVNIDGLELGTLRIISACIPAITCTTLRKLTVSYTACPRIGDGIQLTSVSFCNTLLDPNVMAYTRSLTKVCLMAVDIPIRFFKGLQLTHLSMLDMDDHHFRRDDVRALTRLQYLEFDGEHFPDINSCGCLTELILDDRSQWIRYALGLTALTSLTITSDVISDDVLMRLTTLTKLNTYGRIACTPFTDLAFEPLTLLQHLRIHDNDNVSNHGLVHLDALTYLSVSNTRSIDMAALKQQFDDRRARTGITTQNPIAGSMFH